MDINERGFTLIELMIAMAVGLIVLAAVSALFTVQSRHLANSETITELHQNARIAMDIMVREISMAGYNRPTDPATTPVPRCTDALVAAGTPCVGITNAGTDTISFSADLNGNGSVAAGSTNPNENIVYTVYTSGSVPALGRASNGGSNEPVVEYLENLSFQYLDASGAATAVRENIRKVKITVRVRTARVDPSYTDPTYGGNFRRYTLSSFAIPRNLALAN
jgi:type IV pilus assembly protein PilW